MTKSSEDFIENLVSVNRVLRARFDARAQDLGLTLSRARLLAHLGREDGRSQIELAHLLGVSQPSMTALVNGMEKAGLVERRLQGGDRRARRIFLTPDAQRHVAELLNVIAEIRESVLRQVSPQDLAVANGALQRILCNLKDTDQDE